MQIIHCNNAGPAEVYYEHLALMKRKLPGVNKCKNKWSIFVLFAEYVPKHIQKRPREAKNSHALHKNRKIKRQRRKQASRMAEQYRHDERNRILNEFPQIATVLPCKH